MAAFDGNTTQHPWRDTDGNAISLRDALKVAAPNMVLETTYEHDPSFRWDGDGPDPAELDDPLDPHDVTVSARMIVNGEFMEGNAYMGGTYEPLGGPYDPDIGGYLNQMAGEAIDELVSAMVASGNPAPQELVAAKSVCSGYSRAAYDAQMSQHQAMKG